MIGLHKWAEVGAISSETRNCTLEEFFSQRIIHSSCFFGNDDGNEAAHTSRNIRVQRQLNSLYSCEELASLGDSG